MGTLIGWLIGKQIFGRVIGEKAARVIATGGLIVIVIAALAGVLTLTQCSNGRQEAAQARVSTGQADAFANSAADSIAVQQAASGRERASEDQSRTNEKEIRDAQGANDAVNPAVRDAGVRSLCRRAAYRDSPRCKLLEPPTH